VVSPISEAAEGSGAVIDTAHQSGPSEAAHRISSGAVVAAHQSGTGNVPVSAAASSSRWKFIIPAGVVLAVLVAGAFFLRSQKARALTEKDSILVLGEALRRCPPHSRRPPGDDHRGVL
jgi:hypothetical protein